MHTVVAAALVGILLLGASAAEPNAGTPTASTVSARSLLAQIPVKPEHDSGYERAKFGGFIDADGDGCDTRGEVLLAEATRMPKVTAGCRLVGGRWVSPYDATVHTSAAGLQIDTWWPCPKHGSPVRTGGPMAPVAGTPTTWGTRSR